MEKSCGGKRPQKPPNRQPAPDRILRLVASLSGGGRKTGDENRAVSCLQVCGIEVHFGIDMGKTVEIHR